MNVGISGPALWNEANRLNELAQAKGTPSDGWTEAPLSDHVTLSRHEPPGLHFAGPNQPTHPDVATLVEFTALKADGDSVQVMADYEFQKNGNLRREVHDNAWCGHVVIDTLVSPDGTILRHEVTDGLSPASQAVLDEWHIAR